MIREPINHNIEGVQYEVSEDYQGKYFKNNDTRNDPSVVFL